MNRYHSLADDPAPIRSPLHIQQSNKLDQMTRQFLASGGHITVIQKPLPAERPQKKRRGVAIQPRERTKQRVTRHDWEALIEQHRKNPPDLPAVDGLPNATRRLLDTL